MQKITIIMLLLIGLLMPEVSQGGAWTGNINTFMGIKTLDSDDWDDPHRELSEQVEGGIFFDIIQTDLSSDNKTFSSATIIISSFSLSFFRPGVRA